MAAPRASSREARSPSGGGQTLSQKILERASGLEHVVPGQIVDGRVDLAMCHEQGAQAVLPFHQMEAKRVWDVDRVVVAIDHWVPASTEGAAKLHQILRHFAAEQGLKHFYDVGNHGICHQILAEHGWVVPGDLAVGTDSHTNMLGAMGAFAVGIGPTEYAAVLALGKIWLKVPTTIQVKAKGHLARGVYAKDLVLRICGEIKVDGARYKAVEYTGPTISNLSMSERFTICNMTTEMGAKAGMVPPDEKTFDYLKPIAKHAMHPLTPDKDASYERTVEIDVDGMEPQVACPYSPDNVRPIGELVKEHVKVGQVFLGSCTNARMDDLREAARIFKGEKVAPGVRFIVSPASTSIYKQCLKEGLIELFTDGGAVFTNSSCSACFGGNMGILAPDEACASSSNRNFPGRMGAKEARIYLMSPAAVALTAIRGEISDPREVL
ncbi:MAG: 3-isopropylmalate dehydratase large subunit [Euryarchaeota archaeon]|nr:3-isopropylmalate dehydratase large subunit [Euryarchaeota archaeon]MDE1835694.1 3-isopropylmalate dehydratase large subunit [Euryarchaeota archaeon]MDE1880444.1 3-isopropylmalate dehydratase large subunit [Euryarchaeota archaeon]MDE2043884.1 3-isopropylmalate dehydratase large subunit [Thermoplasmata archaeon]